jgi:vesicle coat complex subunit
MTNEQMERKMEFIVDTLARVAVNDEKHEMRLSRLERIAKLMVNAGRRERRARHEADERLKDGMIEGNEHLKRAMAESDERLMNAMVELAEAQKRTQESIAHTDKNLAALIDTVLRQQNGGSNN